MATSRAEKRQEEETFHDHPDELMDGAWVTNSLRHSSISRDLDVVDSLPASTDVRAVRLSIDSTSLSTV